MSKDLTISISDLPDDVMSTLWQSIKDAFPELDADTIETDSIKIDGKLAYNRYNDGLRGVICGAISIHCAQRAYHANQSKQKHTS